jgi:hypothetical protein
VTEKERVVITGAPRAGKTTISEDMEHVRHADDLMTSDWSKQSEGVVAWFQEPGPWVIEGTAAVRGLRKWFRDHDTAPCDRVIWMPEPKEDLTPGQASMAKSVATVWGEVRQRLLDLGVQVEERRL